MINYLLLEVFISVTKEPHPNPLIDRNVKGENLFSAYNLLNAAWKSEFKKATDLEIRNKQRLYPY